MSNTPHTPLNQSVFSDLSVALKALGVPENRIPDTERERLGLFQKTIGIGIDFDRGPVTDNAVRAALKISPNATYSQREKALIRISHAAQSEEVMQAKYISRTETTVVRPENLDYHNYGANTYGRGGFTHYENTHVARGTFTNPSPLEVSIMKLEGFRSTYGGDGFGFKSGGYGYYKPFHGHVNHEQAYHMMQDQIVEKIHHARAAFGPNFDRMSPNQQEALTMLAYNIDVASPKKVLSLKHAIFEGDFEKAGEKITLYCHASGSRHACPGLQQRRQFEHSVYTGHYEQAFAQLQHWKDMSPREAAQCVAYYHSVGGSARYGSYEEQHPTALVASANSPVITAGRK